MPQFGNSFVDWGRYLSLNEDQAEDQANSLHQGLDTNAAGAMAGIQSAEASTQPGKAINFSDGLRGQVNNATDELGAAAGGTYGLQALLQRRRAGTGYTSGMGLYDAALTGSAAGSKFQGLRGKYRDLFGGMEAAQGRRTGGTIDPPKDGGDGGRVGGGHDMKDPRNRLPDDLAGGGIGGGAPWRDLGLDRGKDPDPDLPSDPYADWFERWGR